MTVPVIDAAGGRPGQIGILVESIDATLAGYGAPAHVEPTWRIWTYGPGSLSSLVYRDAPGTFAIRIALGGTDPQVELIESLTGPSVFEEWRASGRLGLHHIGYYVPDVRAIIPAMQAAGFPLLMAGLGNGADGSGGFAYFDTTDAIGFIAEAIEVPGARRPPERTWPAEG